MSTDNSSEFRLTRERDEAQRAHDDLSGQLTAARREAAIGAAMKPFDFKHPDDVRALIERSVQAEGDAFRMRTPEGRFVSVADGVAAMAAARPEYLNAPVSRGTGSGYAPHHASTPRGNWAGSREERQAAIRDKFNL